MGAEAGPVRCLRLDRPLGLEQLVQAGASDDPDHRAIVGASWPFLLSVPRMSRIRLPAPLALWCAALAIVVTLTTGITAGAAGTAGRAPTVKVFFGQGEQLVAVQRPGATVQDALTALIAGPTPAETEAGFRTYVPAGTRVRSVTIDGDVATVDLGAGFLQGTATDTTLARLDQVVSTVTVGARRHVRCSC